MSDTAASGARDRRRRVREAVVQFLYATDPAGGDAVDSDELVLALLLEPLREKVVVARTRGVLHLQQGRAHLANGLPDLVQRTAQVKGAKDDGQLAQALRELQQAEQDVLAALNYLRHELNGNKSAARFAEGLEEAGKANLLSRAAAETIRKCDPTFPAMQQLRKEALALCEALSEPVGRLTRALAPDPGSQPELRAVLQAENEAAEMAERIHTSLAAVRSHLDAIDQHLASVVKNYSPERIDRVDRAILRLATCELLFEPGIPPAVSIDEAIELARSFGTTNSPKFVNGVLDKLSKTASG